MPASLRTRLLFLRHLSEEMADDTGFRAVEECDASRRDVENKRKYDDAGLTEEEEEPGLRYNKKNADNAVDDDGGFTAAVAAPVSYNTSVATSMSEFELAKQRAELIAARLVTGAELKRPRIEESSEEQQSGLGRSNSSDFDQKCPGKSGNCTCVISMASLSYSNNAIKQQFACVVVVLLFPLRNQ